MENRKHIGREMGIISNKIRRKIDHEVSKYGLTGVQAKILGFVYCASKDQEVFQKDIENNFKIRSSSVTSVLQLMEKKGYIKRISVYEDARLKKIMLTDKGNEVQEAVFNILDNIENQIQEEITDEELNFLFSIFDKLSKKLSD